MIDKTESQSARGNALFEAPCDAGKLMSCSLLGEILVAGIGVPVDRPRGLALLHEACDGGVDRVQAARGAGRSATVVRLCYDERVKKRPGGTTHLSISLPTEEARILKRRAKRAYDGNVSRVVSDAIRYIAYEEGRDQLIASFGGKGKPTLTEAAHLDHAWGLVATKSA